MRLRTLVWRELFERKTQMLTCFLAIFVGITAVVALKNVTLYSKKAVAREVDSLGANVLVLPKSVTLQDYYSADMSEEVIPEEYVTRLVMSDVQGESALSVVDDDIAGLGTKELRVSVTDPNRHFDLRPVECALAYLDGLTFERSMRKLRDKVYVGPIETFRVVDKRVLYFTR